MHQSSPAAVRFIYKASVLHDMRLVSAIVVNRAVLTSVIIISTMMVLSLPSPSVISNRCGEVLAPLK